MNEEIHVHVWIEAAAASCGVCFEPIRFCKCGELKLCDKPECQKKDDNNQP